MGMLFLNTVKQIGIFMICAQAVMYFKRNESYEKYLKLLVSMMVMVQFLIPVFSIFKEGGTKEFEERIAAYERAMETDIEEIKFIEVLAEEKLREMTLEEVKERVSQEIRIEEVEVKTSE